MSKGGIKRNQKKDLKPHKERKHFVRFADKASKEITIRKSKTILMFVCFFQHFYVIIRFQPHCVHHFMCGCYIIYLLLQAAQFPSPSVHSHNFLTRKLNFLSFKWETVRCFPSHMVYKHKTALFYITGHYGCIHDLIMLICVTNSSKGLWPCVCAASCSPPSPKWINDPEVVSSNTGTEDTADVSLKEPLNLNCVS